MSPTAAAALLSWSLDPWLAAGLAATLGLYSRGLRELRRQAPERFAWRRLAYFAGGLAALVVAVASPLDAFAGMLLGVHMVQHLLLTMVAPPLIWLGWPALPLLRGLPPRLARELLGPFLSWPALHRVAGVLVHPAVCLVAFVAASWLWHLPRLYELALRSPGWHALEHLSFFLSALLFWWPVVQPWPSRARWPRWAMIPYLALGDLQNTVLSALLVFGERVLYPTYASAPRLLALSPLEDQQAAGALMWVGGAMAFLAPAGVISTGLLTGPRMRPDSRDRRDLPAGDRNLPHVSARDCGLPDLPTRDRRQAGDAADRMPTAPWGSELAPAWASPSHVARQRAAVRRPPLDLLAMPRLGPVLRSLATRRGAQALLLAAALAVVADGLHGPQVAPMSLAGVLPWTYFRGFLIVALLAVGNLFCAACPFLLPRELARRLRPARRRWPRALRSKWPAVAVLVVYLWAYEAFDLWDSPRATAWVVIGYFAVALAVDATFRGASFCKYLCPIGQLDFVVSTLSPLEVAVRDTDLCAGCASRGCIRGNAAHRGCETGLFLPRKVGNLDCTFCLDCARACPHDNVGLLGVVPGAELLRDEHRSSLRRLARRTDVAALALVLVFGAFVNAAGMTAPVLRATEAASRELGAAAAPAVGLLLTLAALVAIPLALAWLCAAAGRRWSSVAAPRIELSCRFSLTLIPLGASMWLAHVVFHLVTGATSGWPVLQRAALDAGWPVLGEPSWSSGSATGAADLRTWEILALDLGLLATLYLVWRTATRLARSVRCAAGLAAPWAALAVALWTLGAWIATQPMQMRGTMSH